MEEFKDLGVLFMSPGKMEVEIDRRIITRISSDANCISICRVEEEAELKCKPLDLPFNLISFPHLWSRAMARD